MLTEFFQHYLKQAERLPEAVAERVRADFPGEEIHCYALVDLDARLNYTEQWLVLLEHHLVLAVPNDSPAQPASSLPHKHTGARGREHKLPTADSSPLPVDSSPLTPDSSLLTANLSLLTDADTGQWRVQSWPLAEIDKFETFDGLSSNRLHIVDSQAHLLAALQYTRRQSPAVSNVSFVAEQLRTRRNNPGQARAAARDIDAEQGYQEAILKPVQDARAMFAMKKMGVLLRLLSYMAPHKRTVIACFISVLLFTAIGLFPPVLTRFAIDHIFQPLSLKEALAHRYYLLGIIVVLLLGIVVVNELLSFFRMRAMAYIGERIAATLRADLYIHMQKLSLSFFSTHTTGSLITRVSSDTDRLWDFIAFGFLDVAMSALQLFGVAIALFFQDWSLGLIVLIPIPVCIFLFIAHNKRMNVLFTRIWRKWSLMTSVLSDVLPGVRVVKAFAKEDHEIDRFVERSSAVEEEAKNLHREWTRFWPTISVLMHCSIFLVWIVGAPRVIDYFATGHAHGMTPGAFIAFTSYMWMFWDPVQRLGMMSRTVNRVTTSAARIFEVLDTVPAIVNAPDPITLPSIRGQIAFDDVTFSYDGIRNVLKGVSFAVEPGEMIGLVGPSGGGKTTLVNLICRFYEVKDGRVFIDGHDVRALELTSLRRQIGVVLQEPYLFHGTIMDNIAYGIAGCHLAQYHPRRQGRQCP